MEKLFSIAYSVTFSREEKKINVYEQSDHAYKCTLYSYRFPVREVLLSKEDGDRFKGQFLGLKVLENNKTHLPSQRDFYRVMTYLDYEGKGLIFEGFDPELDELMNGIFQNRKLESFSYSDSYGEAFSFCRDGRLEMQTEFRSLSFSSQFIERILDLISVCGLFLNDGAKESSYPDKIPTYSIKLGYTDNEVIEKDGLLDLKGIPSGWSDFTDLVNSVVAFKLPLKAFDSGIYSTGRMPDTLKDRIIAVQFQEGGQEYQYRTDRNDLRVGDRVIVPVGRERALKIVTVSDTSADAPVGYPYEKMKHIIRKAEEPGYVPRQCGNFRLLLAEKETYELLRSLSGASEDKDITRDVLINKVHLDSEAFEELKAGVALLDKKKPILDDITCSLDHYLFESMIKPHSSIDSVPLLLRWYALARELSDLFVYVNEDELNSRLEKSLHDLGLTKKSGKAKKSDRWPEKKMNKQFIDLVRSVVPRICSEAVRSYIRAEGLLR